MKRKYILYCFSVLFFFLNCLTLKAQTSPKDTNYFSAFDTSVNSQNTGLYNGIVYYDNIGLSSEKHRFFETSDFVNGSILYDGQTYYDIPIKYDVYSDIVLVKLKNGFNEVILQPVKDKVEEFSIGSSPFIKIQATIGKRESLFGFYENLLSNSFFTLYKKHKKLKKKRLDESVVYFDFLDKYEYVLLYKSAYYPVKGKGSISKVFPEFKKEINTFYKENSSIKKTDPDGFMISVLNHVYALMLDNKTGEK